MKRVQPILRTVLLLAVLLSPWLSAQPSLAAEPPPKAALFVQNLAGVEFDNRLATFKDLVATRLTEKGFSVIDPELAIDKFRESRSRTPAESELLTLEEAQSAGQLDTVLGKASALRIGQLLGADYLVVATLNSFGTETKNFSGYGIDNRATEFRLRLGLKVLEGASGGTLYGDLVTTTLRKSVDKHLAIATDDILPQLLDLGAVQLAEKVSSQVNRISQTPVKTAAMVEFAVSSNVEANVELDGAVIGTTPGKFQALPGLHQLRLSGQWLTPWEKTVNIVANQTLSVTLQLSNEGVQRFATLEALKIELERAKKDVDLSGRERENQIAIDKEQSSADVDAKAKLSEGRKTMLEESHIRIEGPPAASNRGDQTVSPEALLPSVSQP